MRTQLELWQVVKDNFDEYFDEGLCITLYKMQSNVITLEEKKLLIKELKNYGNTACFFLGEIRNPKPRLEFIDKMIKKHSENAITENK